MRNLREGFLCLIQANIFSDQVFVGERDAAGELLFSPAIEPIPDAGLPFCAGRESLSLSFQETLGLFVVCVRHDRKIEQIVRRMSPEELDELMSWSDEETT